MLKQVDSGRDGPKSVQDWIVQHGNGIIYAKYAQCQGYFPNWCTKEANAELNSTDSHDLNDVDMWMHGNRGLSIGR